MQNFSSDRKIEVGELYRQKCFSADFKGILTVKWGSHMFDELNNLVGDTIFIQVYMTKNLIEIGYVIKNFLRVNQRIIQEIRLLMTSCEYGGCRYWFECPHCFRRVGVLYKPDEAISFWCRHCHKTKYFAQSISKASRHNLMYRRIYFEGRISELEDKVIRRPFYAGKLTKNHQKLKQLNRQIELEDSIFAQNKYNNGIHPP